MKRVIFFVAIFWCLYTNYSFGQRWSSSYPSAGLPINSAAITKPGNIVIGGGGIQSGNSLQLMFHSSDYGTTWVENQADGLAEQNNSIAFADSLNGFGVGPGGRIISTQDGGNSWINPVYPFARDWKKIVNVSSLTYYVVGGINDSVQTVFKTIDGAVHWNIVRDTAGPGLNAAYFFNDLAGCAVGDSGVIITTTDGGITWAKINAPIIRNFYAVTFINTDTGYIVGGADAQSSILKTVDGGANWAVILDQTGPMLRDISFADSNNGYIAGDSARFAKSTDGGQTWNIATIPGALTTDTFTAVKFYSANFGVVTTTKGYVFVYTNLPAPVIQNEQVIFKAGDTVLLNARVNTFNAPDSVSFIYSSDPQLNGASTTGYIALNNSSSSLVGADISSLAAVPGTYYFTCVVKTLDSTFYGDTLMFIMPFTQPRLNTLTGSNVTSNSITLRGQVSSLLHPSSLFFEYQSSLDTSVVTVQASPQFVNDTLYHVVVQGISGLLPYTPYVVRIKAISGNAVMYGNYLHFSTTSGVTEVTTLPATGITAATATLQGQVGYLPFSASVKFQYSLYDSANILTVNATPAVISDTGFHFVSAPVTGLVPNSYYQYRVEVTNILHTLYGDYNYFYNGPNQNVSVDSATGVNATSATLNGHIDKLGFTANILFHYSSDGHGEGLVPAFPAVVSDTQFHYVFANIAGLRPFTQYSYTLTAENLPLQLQSANVKSFYTGPGYHNSLILNTEPASALTNDSATLNGFEVNLPDSGTAFFDFWQSGDTPITIAVTNGAINDSLAHHFSAVVNGLNPNTLYLFRIKVSGTFGTVYGDSVSFYTGANTIPNFDFEHWTTTTATKPDNWSNLFGPLQKVSPGANGSLFAVKVQRSQVGNNVLISNALPAGGNGGVNSGNGTVTINGGFAYAARPDTLSGMFQYDILPGDTAYVCIEFKSAGQVLTQQFMPIYGSSQVFKKLSFPIHYNSAAIPDTLILAFLSSNVFANYPVIGSSLTIDELTFGASFPPVPNGNFENWSSLTFHRLDGWSYQDFYDFGYYTSEDSGCVYQYPEPFHGNYAMQLGTRTVDGHILDGSGDVSTQPQPNTGNGPDFALNHRPAMLTGYYRFFPQNGDTLNVGFFIYKNGAVVGTGNFRTNQLVSNYTYFSALCNYSGTTYIVPDSASIEIRTQGNNAMGLSRAIIDYLAFDGYVPADTVLSVVPLSANFVFDVYPNPANNKIVVKYTGTLGTTDYLKIYDLLGSEVYETETSNSFGEVEKELDLSKLECGVYFITLKSGSFFATNKIIVER